MTAEPTPFNLSPAQWASVFARAQSGTDALEDGAFVRVEEDVLVFYATALSKPQGWRLPFLEPVPGTRQVGAMVGQAAHDPATGFVELTPTVYAAAQAVTADYESDVGDMDYVAYENAVADAVRGTPADAAWLHGEFGRLLRVAG